MAWRWLLITSCLCIEAHNNMCRAFLLDLNYYTMVYKCRRNQISVHLRSSRFGFSTMNWCVEWRHLLAAFSARFFIEEVMCGCMCVRVRACVDVHVKCSYVERCIFTAGESDGRRHEQLIQSEADWLWRCAQHYQWLLRAPPGGKSRVRIARTRKRLARRSLCWHLVSSTWTMLALPRLL